MRAMLANELATSATVVTASEDSTRAAVVDVNESFESSYGLVTESTESSIHCG